MHDIINSKRNREALNTTTQSLGQLTASPSSSIPNSAMASSLESPECTQAELLNSRTGTPKQLPELLKARLEMQFGRSLSGISILESPEVKEAGAYAYAKGDVVRFAPGQFDPQSKGGQAMIAHELSHVVQQSQGMVRPDSPDSPLASDGALEEQADASIGAFHMAPPEPMNAMPFQYAPAQMTETDLQGWQGRVNTGEFNFDRYRFDGPLRRFKQLLDAYNEETSGGTPEQEIALMQAAADYIEEHSTKATAEHKGRTAMMEDVLYQLAMRDGTQGKADANINQLKRIKNVRVPDGAAAAAAGTGYANAAEAESDADSILEDIRSLYDPESQRYSKAMQMIAAEVMSLQDRTQEYTVKASGGNSSAGVLNRENPGNQSYRVEARMQRLRGNLCRRDAVGTSFHEFTHVAGGESFDNTGLNLSYTAETPHAELLGEISKRHTRLNQLRQLAGSSPNGNEEVNETHHLLDYTRDRADYGSGTYSERYAASALRGIVKTMLPIRRNQDDNTQEVETARNHPWDETLDVLVPRLPEWIADMNSAGSSGISDEAAKRITDDYNNITDFQSLTKEADRRHMSADVMVEYDPVINQLFSQYEMSFEDRDSRYYRTLKAAAIQAHVRRRAAALMRRADDGAAEV